MDTNILLSKVSMIFGIFLIVILSGDDFRKHVRKFISRWRYYFAGAIFVSFNLFVYLVLTYAVIQQSPAVVIYEGIKVNGNILDKLMPLFLAVVYFGAGAGSFKIGNKEIQLNKKLRDALEGMFNSKPLDPMDVSYHANEKIQIYKKLRSEADKIKPLAKDRNWRRLTDQWEDFEQDESIFKEQIIYLNGLNDRLSHITSELPTETAARVQLTKVMLKIQAQIHDMQQRLIIKVQKMLVAFAFKYYKDEAELKNYLIQIKLLNTSGHQAPYAPSVVNRGLILGFMFGLLFGPLFGIYEGGDVIFYCWRGAFSLMLFTGCVSFGIHSGCWKQSVLVAGAGGYIAHFFWRFIDTANFAKMVVGDFSWFLKPITFTEPIVGLSYGIATALILYALKFQLSYKVSSKYVLYAVSTLSGAAIYPGLNYLISSKDITQTSVIITAWIGAIVMASLSLAVNVAVRVEEPDLPKPGDDEGTTGCLVCEQRQERQAA